MPGDKLAMAVISYSVIRFFLQFLRGDYEKVLLGLDISQIISLILCIAGCLLLYRLKKKAVDQEEAFPLQGEAIAEK